MNYEKEVKKIHPDAQCIWWFIIVSGQAIDCYWIKKSAKSKVEISDKNRNHFNKNDAWKSAYEKQTKKVKATITTDADCPPETKKALSEMIDIASQNL